MPALRDGFSAVKSGTSRGLKANIVLRFSRLKIKNFYSLLPVACMGFRAGTGCTEEEESYVGPLKMGNDQT